MLASVDIGSNSVKYLFAKFERGALVTLETGSWVTRLGKQLAGSDGLFNEDSLESTKKALQEIAERITKKRRQIEQIDVVATAAARNAKNPEAIEQLVLETLGLPLHIISGEREAHLSMTGAQQAAKEIFQGSQFVFMDIGGASTEVGFLEPAIKAHSFEGGALKCHEGLKLDKMPVSDSAWSDAKVDILDYFPDSQFTPLLEGYQPENFRAVAVGGTLLSAVDLCPNLVSGPSGTLVEKYALETLANKLRLMSIRKRMAMAGMDKNRADILPAGILVLNTCLNRLAQNEVFVTSWGLRHGLVSQHL